MSGLPEASPKRRERRHLVLPSSSAKQMILFGWNISNDAVMVKVIMFRQGTVKCLAPSCSNQSCHHLFWYQLAHLDASSHGIGD